MARTQKKRAAEANEDYVVAQMYSLQQYAGRKWGFLGFSMAAEKFKEAALSAAANPHGSARTLHPGRPSGSPSTGSMPGGVQSSSLLPSSLSHQPQSPSPPGMKSSPAADSAHPHPTMPAISASQFANLTPGNRPPALDSSSQAYYSSAATSLNIPGSAQSASRPFAATYAAASTMAALTPVVSPVAPAVPPASVSVAVTTQAASQFSSFAAVPIVAATVPPSASVGSSSQHAWESSPSHWPLPAAQDTAGALFSPPSPPVDFVGGPDASAAPLAPAAAGKTTAAGGYSLDSTHLMAIPTSSAAPRAQPATAEAASEVHHASPAVPSRQLHNS